MPAYPLELVRRHRLSDGTEIVVRPVREADVPIEGEFERHLSGDSRYFRFMRALGDVSPEKLKFLREVDYDRRMGLVATIAREGGETEIGAAMYSAPEKGSSCEFAIAVDDAWQGRGVAGLLMAHLMEAARAHGFRTMMGVVLADNHRMLRFVRQLGFTCERSDGDPHIWTVVREL
ncbi:MAG: hypothetical protein Fur0039_07990 [Rhodocyclaceae bacterium]